MTNKSLIEDKRKRFQRAESHFSHKLDNERTHLNEQRVVKEEIEKELTEIGVKLTQTKLALDQCLSVGDITRYKELIEWLSIYQEKMDDSEQDKKRVEKVMNDINQRILLLSKKKERSHDRENQSRKKLVNLRDEQESDWFIAARNNRSHHGN